MIVPIRPRRIAQQARVTLDRARAIASTARSWLTDAVTFALPQRCPSCGAETVPGLVLCRSCFVAIPRAEIVVCARCLALGREPVHCLRHGGFRTGVAWVYDERAAALIGAFKYGARPDLADLLADELARAPRPVVKPDLITEVPLHPARRRERGYDQAALLAAAYAERAGVPWLPGVLERTRATPAQARLGAEKRRANLARAFRVRRPESLEGRRVLLVDDVITTGATLESGLATLSACGAEAAALAIAWAQS